MLRQPVGGPQVMAAQLRHIAKISELPNVSVRVKPFATGFHAGMAAGGYFAILDFPEDREPTTVYSDGLTGAIFLDKPAEAARYTWAFKQVRDMCFNEQESRDLLLQVAEEYAA